LLLRRTVGTETVRWSAGDLVTWLEQRPGASIALYI
jgi:hypothetical protein